MRRMLVLFTLFSLNTQAAQFDIPIAHTIANPGVCIVHYEFESTDTVSDGNSFTAFDTETVEEHVFHFDTANYENKSGLFRVVIQAMTPDESSDDEEGREEDLFIYHLFVDERLPGGGMFMNEVGLDPFCILGTGAHFETFAPSADTTLFDTGESIHQFHGNKGFIFLTQEKGLEITWGDITFFYDKEEDDDEIHVLTQIKNISNDTQINVPPPFLETGDFTLDDESDSEDALPAAAGVA